MTKLSEFEQLSVRISREYVAMFESYSKYQKVSGLHCPSGCGACCTNPDIEASPLEMLPMALYLLECGKLNKAFFEKLDMSCYCFAYQADSTDKKKGYCEQYQNRPSVCRMFGVAGFRKKDQSLTLAVCKKLKEDNKATYESLMTNIGEAPLMEKWSTRIRVLDPELGLNYHKINQALKIISEKILTLKNYEECD